jgi:hypothetical protein
MRRYDRWRTSVSIRGQGMLSAAEHIREIELSQDGKLVVIFKMPRK